MWTKLKGPVSELSLSACQEQLRKELFLAVLCIAHCLVANDWRRFVLSPTAAPFGANAGLLTTEALFGASVGAASSCWNDEKIRTTSQQRLWPSSRIFSTTMNTLFQHTSYFSTALPEHFLLFEHRLVSCTHLAICIWWSPTVYDRWPPIFSVSFSGLSHFLCATHTA